MSDATSPRAALGNRQRSGTGPRILVGIVWVWFALLILAPTIALAKAAFGEGLVSFWNGLNNREALDAFALTIWVTVAATVVNTLFGVAFAMVLVRHRFWGKALIDGLVDLPFAVSPIIAGLMLVVVYGPMSPIGAWLDRHGLRVVYSWPGLVMATTFVTLPFVVREVVPVLREFGVDQEEVAHTLGAGRWRTFTQVTLPSIRWGLAYGVTLTVARSLGEFGALLVVSGNILGRTQTATLFVHDGIESFHPQSAYAASVVLAGMSFVLMIGMETLRRRVAASEHGV